MTQFTFDQDEYTHTVSPLTYDEAVTSFYGGSGTETSANLERSDTSFVFFYEAGDGGPLSLVFIHDKPGDNSGGAVSFEMTFSGSASDAEWVIRDDDGDFFNGRSNPNWTWNDNNKDGGVLQGGFDGNFELRVDPAFNEEAVRNPLTSGEITDWKLLSGGGDGPTQMPLNMSQRLDITSGSGSGGDVSASTSTVSFIPGEDEDSLQNATGSPLNSAVADIFDSTFSFEFRVDEDFDLGILGDFSVEWDGLEVLVTPAFDSWGTGDEIAEDPPDQLDQTLAAKQNKYRDEFPGEEHEQYRIRNTVDVSFGTDGSGSIDESSVRIEFEEDFAWTVLEAEDVNTLDPEAIGASSQETSNGTSYYFEGQGIERYSDWEVTQVDGVDAVKVSTIVGGHTAVAKELIDAISDYSSLLEYVRDVIGWEFRVDGDPVDDFSVIPDPIRSAVESKITGMVEMLAATPNIFTFLEFTVLANGRRFVQLWDASMFPKHALYMESQQYDITDLPYEPQENFNGNFNAFLAEAATGLVTPYHAPRLAYEAHLTDGAFQDDPRLLYQKYASFIPETRIDQVVSYEEVVPDSTPMIQYGEQEDGTEIDSETVDSLIGDSPLFPWD